MKVLKILGDAMIWFLVGACLALASNQHQTESRLVTVATPPADVVCRLSPAAIRQALADANQAGLDQLANYHLQLLAAQVTSCN